VSGIRDTIISEQADKFLGWFARLGSADRGEAFRRWVRSKDFAPQVRRRIARTVARQTEDRR
jgi:hypothetical protein